MTHIEFTGSGGISASFPTPGANGSIVVQNGTGKVIASLTADGTTKWKIKHGLNTMAITGSIALNRPMYPETVKATAGLVAYWRMDEANTAKDVTGGLTAEALGQTVPTTAGANLPGDLDLANKFPGEAANTFTFATTATLELKKELSVECFVKPGVAGNPYGFFEKSVAETTNSSYLLFQASSKATFRVRKGASNEDASSSGALSTIAYSHLVGTFEPTKSKLYVNGKLEAEKTIAAGEINSGAGKSYIGVLAPTVAPLNGNLDELAIYNKPLSEAQVAEHAAQITLGRPGEVQALEAKKKIVALTPNEVEVTYEPALSNGEILWVTLIG